ncbi:MAG: rhomboid family intramembrane serine protease [Acidobacteria bacterium]|nr:rhomboid family intramembrane serine protease [Acidobacteriota bacterium]
MRYNMFGGPAAWAVKKIITANVIVFALQFIAYRFFGSNFLEFYFGLIPESVTREYRIWQLATYMFLHGGPIHILVNMLMLYMFGNELERLWGTRRFLQYYFVTGIGAGVCSWIVGVHDFVVIIGASGAIYGILLAYGLMYPNRIVYFGMLFPIRVKWMVILMGALAFLSSIGETNSGIAHVAHLGGMVVGFIYLRGKYWLGRVRDYENRRQHDKLKRRFEVYYGDVRRKIEEDKKKKGPTIH